MFGSFNVPEIDHLTEGVDYEVLDWSYAAPSPLPGQPDPSTGRVCPDGYKMVFGKCRKLKVAAAPQPPPAVTSAPAPAAPQSPPTGSYRNDTPQRINGANYGWAKKGSSLVLVSWKDVEGSTIKLPKMT